MKEISQFFALLYVNSLIGYFIAGIMLLVVILLPLIIVIKDKATQRSIRRKRKKGKTRN